MYLMDYHHHTNHSFDSKADMDEVCAKAIQNDIKEICFTEHFSVNPKAPTYGHIKFRNYLQDIRNCQAKYGHDLKIKTGIELCEPHLLADQYEEALQPLPLDFVLGSVHNINNQKLRLILKEYGSDAYSLYFNEVNKMVSEADIDVIAHFDLMKRYGYKEYGIYSFDEYEDQIEQILRTAIERKIGLEINTSGLRSGLNDTMPSLPILKKYKELGGEIVTIGSDSHKSETVGANFYDAARMAKLCGFAFIYKYEARKPIAVEI